MRTGFIYQRSEKFTHHSYQILNHRHTFKIVNLSYKYHDLFSVLNKKVHYLSWFYEFHGT